MPKKKHAELARRARALGLTGDAYNSYVYGTLSTIKKRRKAKQKRTSRKPKKSTRKRRRR